MLIYIFPAIDVTVTSLNVPVLVRSSSQLYHISSDITHTAGHYHIVQTTQSNFQLQVFFNDLAVTDGATVAGRSDLIPITLSNSSIHATLDISGSGTLHADSAIELDLATCEDMHFMCIYVTNTTEGTFVEDNEADNVLCIDFDAIKNCTPEVHLDVTDLSLSDGTEIIRGYNEITQFQVVLSNIDDDVFVESVPSPRVNYEVTIHIRSTDLAADQSGLSQVAVDIVIAAGK